MRSLYKINADIEDLIYNAEVDEDGEYLIDVEKLNQLQIERDEKLKGIAIVIKSKAVYLDALKAEKKELTRRIASEERAITRLKDWLKAELNGEKIDAPEVRASYHTTRNIVEIDDETKIPLGFMNVKIEQKPDKTLLKEAILEGEIIDGVRLVDKISIVIK